MLPHAPGVQMSTIPEDGVTLKEESEAADEADPDKRNPPQLKDKQIEPENEFDGAPGTILYPEYFLEHRLKKSTVKILVRYHCRLYFRKIWKPR